MKEDYGKKNIFPQQTLKLYENNIGQDLVVYRSQEIIVMIEDLPQQTGFADVNKQGRKNSIWFQENVQFLVTWKNSLGTCQMTQI